MDLLILIENLMKLLEEELYGIQAPHRRFGQVYLTNESNTK